VIAITPAPPPSARVGTPVRRSRCLPGPSNATSSSNSLPVWRAAAAQYNRRPPKGPPNNDNACAPARPASTTTVRPVKWLYLLTPPFLLGRKAHEYLHRHSRHPAVPAPRKRARARLDAGNGNDEGKLAPHSAHRTAHGLGSAYRRLGSLGHGWQLRRGGSAGPRQPGAHESNRRPSSPRPPSAGTTAVPSTTLPRSPGAGVSASIAGCGSPRFGRGAAGPAPTATS